MVSWPGRLASQKGDPQNVISGAPPPEAGKEVWDIYPGRRVWPPRSDIIERGFGRRAGTRESTKRKRTGGVALVIFLF